MREYAKYYFFNNFIDFAKLLIISIIGVIVAIILINNTNFEGKKEIKSITDSKMAIVKNSEEVNKNKVFGNAIIKNARQIAILTILSASIIGIPIAYFLVLGKAFSIGYTVSAIFATQSMKTSLIFICFGLLIHNLLELISMFIIVVAGENFVKSVLQKDKKLKFEIFKYLIFVFIAFLIVIISTFCEAYMSTFLLDCFKKYL